VLEGVRENNPFVEWSTTMPSIEIQNRFEWCNELNVVR